MLPGVDLQAAMQQRESAAQGLATRAFLHSCGVSRSAVTCAVRDGVLLRLARRVYASAPLPPWPRFVVTDEGVSPGYVKRVRLALLSLGAGAAARRRTAAALRGWGMLVEPGRTVEVAVPHGSSRSAALDAQVRQVRDLAVDVLQMCGTDPLSVTTALQTAVQCLTELPLLQAVVVVDSALRAGDVTLAELATALASLPGTRGAERGRRALALCDPESGSVLESVLRVRMEEAGITGFATQVTISGPRGARILRVDFCFEAARLVIETDGARWHPDGSLDRARDNRLAAAGWRVIRLTWADVVHSPAAAIELIRAALDPVDFQSGTQTAARAA